ncbi:hypothetical protein Ae201684P_004677 [Aphanomyces euteiches]|nr:hypothetical protein Ae201684P_004677 [Aphanomyces euteiches]
MRRGSGVLHGVKCIVDVHMSAGDVDVDCSEAVRKKLEGLGAKVVKKISKDTTHVVWLNGNRNVREDTLKRGEVKLVGPLWVEACAQTATLVPETKFFPVDSAKEGTPLLSVAAERKKRRRSSLMEPRREDVFDEMSTPSKKIRRKTLDAIPRLNLTLTPQEHVKTRRLSLPRRSQSFDASSQSSQVPLPSVDEIEDKRETPSSRRKSTEPAIVSPHGSAEKVVPAKTKKCAACTFDNTRKSKNCKICGTSLLNTRLSVESLSKQSISTPSKKSPSTKLSNTPNMKTPSPGKTPPIGRPKRESATKVVVKPSPTIPTIKVASKAQPTPSKKPQAQAVSNKAQQSRKTPVKVEESTKKQSTKRKPTEAADIRRVKSKHEHKPIIKPASKTKPTQSSKPVKVNKSAGTATTIKPIKSTTAATPSKKAASRRVISISGANLDTRLILESTIRELDTSARAKLSMIWELQCVVLFVPGGQEMAGRERFLVGAKLKLLDGKSVYIGSGVEPPRSTLKMLITAAGGQICTQLSQANICIGKDAALARRAKLANLSMVSPKWLFDSLVAGVLEPTEREE